VERLSLLWLRIQGPQAGPRRDRDSPERLTQSSRLRRDRPRVEEEALPCRNRPGRPERCPRGGEGADALPQPGRRTAQPAHQCDGEPAHGALPRGPGRGANDAIVVRELRPQPHPAVARRAARQAARGWRGAGLVLCPAANLQRALRWPPIHRAPHRARARLRPTLPAAPVPTVGTGDDPPDPLDPFRCVEARGPVEVDFCQPRRARRQARVAGGESTAADAGAGRPDHYRSVATRAASIVLPRPTSSASSRFTAGASTARATGSSW
jgi:hypothetical protein